MSYSRTPKGVSQSEICNPRQYRVNGSIKDIPPMPTFYELLIPPQMDITIKKNSRYFSSNGEGKKMGHRKCAKCYSSHIKSEMYHREGSAADYLFCPKCAPAQIERDRKKQEGK